MKQCPRCQETKALDKFNFKDKSKGTYSTYYRSCQSEVSRKTAKDRNYWRINA